jgi:hypothetical protein
MLQHLDPLPFELRLGGLGGWWDQWVLIQWVLVWWVLVGLVGAGMVGADASLMGA